MENKIEKVIIDPTMPFFVHDKWHEKIELFQLCFNQHTYSYHYLKEFFHLSQHDAEEALNDLLNFLEHNPGLHQEQTINFLEGLPTSIAFFARGILAHQKPLETPFLLTNQALTHYKKLSHQHLLSKRIKIKMDLQGINFLFDHEENFKPLIDNKKEIVLDFNQTLTAHDIHLLRKMIEKHPLKNQILYLEDPVKPHEYKHLNKEELHLVALDESLAHIALHEKHLLENISWLVIKPSLYSHQFVENLFTQKKKITISSSYESPSIYRAFLPLIEMSKMSIHGLSTFNIYPDTYKHPYLEQLESMAGDEVLVI